MEALFERAMGMQADMDARETYYLSRIAELVAQYERRVGQLVWNVRGLTATVETLTGEKAELQQALFQVTESRSESPSHLAGGQHPDNDDEGRESREH